MDTRHLLENCWSYVLQLLPASWEHLAKETHAVERLRGISSLDVLLNLLFMHLGLGYSLRETVARGRVANLADISDVALLKRMRKFAEFFRQACLQLLGEQRGQPPSCLTGDLPVRMVDATHVKEPGKTGSVWRLHVAFRLADLACDFFEVTPATGQGTGESFERIPVQSGECIMGDRGYARTGGLIYIHSKGGYSLVRIGSTFPMEDAQGHKFSLLNAMRTLKKPGDCGEWQVNIRHDKQMITGRLCALYKSQDAVDRAQRKLQRRDSKKQMRVSPETRELARYMMVFTTVPEEKLSIENILELYRYRWQIELLFKRFKSLAQLGHLPKRDPESSKAWLYGKLLIILLTEKATVRAKTFSPWGVAIPKRTVQESLA